MSELQSSFVFFRNDYLKKEMVFRHPLDVISVCSSEDFFKALKRIEEVRQQGKWLAGYFSYEAGYLLEPKLSNLLPEGRRVPLLCFGVFNAPVERAIASDSESSGKQNRILDIRPLWNAPEYKERFHLLHKNIKNGNCYQACLTFPVIGKWSGSPKGLFNQLCQKQPVQYGALVSLGEPVILSRSPELFFEIDASNQMRSHPMKGTAKRGKTAQEDEKIKTALANDPKNQAENLMIVDLLRNDMAQISEKGTLQVPELFRVETYQTLHQMISIVEARLLPGKSVQDIFQALFPPGSVTGAPKIRSVEILHELENEPRGAYCGAIGWISPKGPMRFNVAIRTMTLFKNEEALFNAGSGIVLDSTWEAEYRECLLKMAFATQKSPFLN